MYPLYWMKSKEGIFHALIDKVVIECYNLTHKNRNEDYI